MDSIEGILLTPLKRIHHTKGDILHGMKKSERGYAGFGEAYFSNVLLNDIKAWKLHNMMTLNLVVPVGAVKFIMIDKRKNSSTFNNSFEVTISSDNYQRLTIPPGIWFGFKGVGNDLNLIMNIADMEHDPYEVDRKEIEEFDYEW